MSMKIYATNIHIELATDSHNWLSEEDFLAWQQQLFDREEWPTLKHKMLPPGMVFRLKTNDEHVPELLDVDIPLPKKNIPVALRNAIYAISNYVEIESITTTQRAIDHKEYEAVNNTQLDKDFWIKVD